ncbi:MAG: alpha/beta hydrolase [Candidatus Binatia bacterium]
MRAPRTACDEPAGDPDPETDPLAWMERDLQNIRCSRQHSEDQLTNPEFLLRHGLNAGSMYLENVRDQLLEPTRLHVNPVFWSPGARVSDPFRIAEDWEKAGRGQTRLVSFLSRNGTRIIARLFAPNAPTEVASLPGVTVTPGLQAYHELYNWLAQGLAEAGYMVLAIDPEGQGRSESGAGQTNTQPETEDAIDFLLSDENPLRAYLDPERIGIVGHSLGASAVSRIGAADPRVKAVVAFDSLSRVSDELAESIHAPSLSLTGDYPFPLPNGVPASPSNPPNPDARAGAFDQVTGKEVDAMLVSLRSATHYEWSYLPFPSGTVLTASRYGERVSMHYTLAWFDRYLKEDASAFERLTALVFDDSADASSIGQGTWDAATLQNVPYEIAGDCVADRLSFYYHSRYRLTDGDGLLHQVGNLRARGCPDAEE